MPLLSKNVLATSALSAKFAFCGMSPVNLSDERGVKFCSNNSDEVTASVKQRSTAVAGLNGRADLKISRVVTDPCESAHISNRDIGGRGEGSGKGITQCHHHVASADWAPIPESGNRGEREFAPRRQLKDRYSCRARSKSATAGFPAEGRTVIDAQSSTT